jgi:hypothetical protein
MPATTWDDTLKSAAGMTLSGGSLTATATAAASVGATQNCTGPTYFQVTIGTAIATSQQVGMVTRRANFGTTLLGNDANLSIGYHSGGTVRINNAVVTTIQTFAANAVVDVAYNPNAKLIWFRTNNGNWNNDVIANQNPAGNVGGISTAGVSGPLYPAWGAAATGNNATAKFTSGFTYTPPTGYITVDTRNFGALINSEVPIDETYTQLGPAIDGTVATPSVKTPWPMDIASSGGGPISYSFG